MIVFSLYEIRDLIFMSLILGIIFKDMVPLHLRRKARAYNGEERANDVNTFNLEYRDGKYSVQKKSIFGKIKDYFDEDYWFSILLIAPAIVVHELFHKLIAQSFGLTSTFFAAYNWLAVALVLKVISPFFVFFVPGYVATICAEASKYCTAGLEPIPLVSVAIASGGPLANLFLWILASVLLRVYFSREPASLHKKNNMVILGLVIMQKLNLFLFILNMLPIPGFDGFHVFYNLYLVVGMLKLLFICIIFGVLFFVLYVLLNSFFIIRTKLH